MGTWTPGPGATSGDDTFTGDNSNETANGGNGDDTLNGGQGDDSLAGDDGDDVLDGDFGNDVLIGGGGADRFVMGDIGRDTVTDFVPGVDRIDVSALNVHAFAQVQRRLVDVAGGVEIRLGDSPAFTMFLAGVAAAQLTATDFVFDTSTAPIIKTGNPIWANVMFGRSGDDTLTGSSNPNYFDGGVGNDTLRGGVKNDIYWGGAGSDTFVFSELRIAADVINDFQVGIDKVNFVGLRIGDFASLKWVLIDTLAGAQVRFNYFGPVSVTFTGVAASQLTAGDFIFDTSTTNQTINVFNGDIAAFGAGGNDTINGSEGNNLLVGGAGDDTINGNGNDDVLHGVSGNDTLYGGANDDILDGGTGNDTMDGGTGFDLFLFEAGAFGQDEIVAFNPSEDVVNLSAFNLASFAELQSYMADTPNGVLISSLPGGTGTILLRNVLTGQLRAESFRFAEGQTLTGSTGPDSLNGGAGNDIIYGGGGDDVLRGLNGADTVSGGDGNDLVFGDDGNDILSGDAGADTVSGGAGNDTLRGGAGNDVIDGGDASDTDMAVFGVSVLHTAVVTTGGTTYVFTRSEGIDRVTGVETFRFSDATLSRASAERFMTLDYTAGYDDLIAAFGLDQSDARRHFDFFGMSEGRNPVLFDSWQYLAGYNDLIAYLGPEATDVTGTAARHFIQFGNNEGRARDRFDAWEYMASYVEVLGAAAGDETLAAKYFVKVGFAAGHARDNFDGLQYVASHGDLIQTLGEDEAAAARHFVLTGYGQGRSRDTFDAAQYIANYVDLQAAYGSDLYNATRHYILHGYAEGRTDEDLTPFGGDDALAFAADKGEALQVLPVEFDKAGDLPPEVLPNDADFGTLRLALDDGFLMQGLGETPAELLAKGIVLPPEWSVIWA